MKKFILFDFDGTIVKGDSSKILFKKASATKFSFIWQYYVLNIRHILNYMIFGNILQLKERRRLQVLDKIKSSKIHKISLSSELVWNEDVASEFFKDYQSDVHFVIISAGYKEIIESFLQNIENITVIADSLFEKCIHTVNYEFKVHAFKQLFGEGAFVWKAFGNSKGDIPMLRIAQIAFWVDDKGGISKYHF